MSAATTEGFRPISLEYCVDTEHLESFIAFKQIKDVTSGEDLIDEKLRAYLSLKLKTRM